MPRGRGRSCFFFFTAHWARVRKEDLQERKPQDYVQLVGVSLHPVGLSAGFCMGFASRKIPIPSMYGIFAYICHTNQPNVGKYTIHGWYGGLYNLLGGGFK